MLKSIQLKLLKIKHGGDSIGDDIHLEIEIPDYPHSGGARYEKQAPRAKTWFRIGHSGERYLHTGGRSLGCITIIETTRWAEIYNVLVKARKGDFVSAGILEVVN